MKKFICLLSFFSIFSALQAQAEIIRRTGVGAPVTRYGFSYTEDTDEEIDNRENARADALNRAIASAAAPPINTDLCPAGTLDLGTASPIPQVVREFCIQVRSSGDPDPTGVSKCSTYGNTLGSRDTYCYKCTVTLGLTKECALPGN